MIHWLKAFRLRTLPLAFSSIGMGAILAASHGIFNGRIVILSLSTTVSLQILSNLANDYGDSIHGADNVDRVGPSRTVQDGQISMGEMKMAVVLFSVLSLALGLILIFISGLSALGVVFFLVLGAFAIISAILYTNGKLPYGYIGLGDLSVFLFFGLFGVIGTYYLQTKVLRWDIFLPAMSCGLLTVAVLNINNIRDIHSDQLAGKFSIPVRLGRKRASIYHSFLLILAFICSIAYVAMNNSGPKQFILLLLLPLLYVNARAISTKSQDQLDPYLKQMAITNLVFVGVFGIAVM